MKLKKLISTVLAFVLLISCFSLSFTAFAANQYPTLYIQGQGVDIYNAEGKKIYDNGRVPIPEGYIQDNIADCLPSFAMGFITGDFTKWHDDFMAVWEPIYAEVRLDNNGENTSGSYSGFSWNPNTITPYYILGSYHYQPDWRLDPFELARDVNSMIQAIKAKTGKDKVNIISRCEGTNIAMAYLAEFGYEDVNCFTLYVSSVYGVDAVGAAFSGNIKLYPEKLAEIYYNKGTDLISDPAIAQLIDEVLEWAVESYGFEEACALLESMLDEIYEDAVYDAILCSYGSFPGMWALVGPQYYEDARRIIFEGREDEYAGLIEKIDHYDTAVRQCADDILLEAEENGVKVQVIAKYADIDLNAPVCKEAYELTDDAISLEYSSFGATCSRADAVLGKDYLAAADPKYISPDKRVDTSTCILPDSTWIIYNSNHEDFGSSMDVIIKRFIDSNGTMTIDTYEDLPQYIYHENGTIRPMKAGDARFEIRKEPGLRDIIRRFINSFKRFFALIKKVLAFVQAGNE